jgi:DNA-binding MarR family transcriptional regulator
LNEFLVGDDGLLRLRGAHATAEWYAKVSPEANLLSQEAQLLLTKTSARIMDSFRRQGFLWTRYNVLRKLSEAPGRRLSMSEIGEHLEVSPTNITKVVDLLAELDYVRKVQDPVDRRRTWAELTEEGQVAFEGALNVVVERTNKMWKGVSDREKSILIHVLAKVSMNMLLGDEEQLSLDD